jgi:hypothetical protein
MNGEILPAQRRSVIGWASQLLTWRLEISKSAANVTDVACIP